MLDRVISTSTYSNLQNLNANEVGKLGTVAKELKKQQVETLTDDALGGAILAGDLQNVEWSKRVVSYFCLYTETKKFSNTLQIRIFITEIHVEINTKLFIECD